MPQGGLKMKIGIIGAGDVGLTLANLWIQAGHQVFLSSRHPQKLAHVIAELGEAAQAGTVQQAATFGDVIFFAVNYWTVDEAIQAIGNTAEEKIVIDATNPLHYAESGGTERVIGNNEIAGQVMARKLPKARIIKAFTTMWTGYLQQYAHRDGEKVAVPLAGDDPAAKALVASLIEDAGFEPVDIGTLAESRPLDPPSTIWNKVLTATEVRDRVAQFRAVA
jgi:hypothetical protein